jgi:hypothetical protein
MMGAETRNKSDHGGTEISENGLRAFARRPFSVLSSVSPWWPF